MEEMIAHYEYTNSNTLFSQLINLKQKGSVLEHIEDFQKLNIMVTDIPEEHGIDFFIGTLTSNMKFAFWNLIHWRRHSGWQEKLNVKLWRQGNLPLTSIKMEVLPLLDFHNLQGWHHNNWKKKEQKGFANVVISNTLKVISVLRRNYFT